MPKDRTPDDTLSILRDGAPSLAPSAEAEAFGWALGGDQAEYDKLLKEWHMEQVGKRPDPLDAALEMGIDPDFDID